MNILLTGASGTVGRVILAHLAGQHTVFTIGRTPTSSVVADLAAAVPHLPDWPLDVVIHAAGQVPKRGLPIGMYEQVNVTATHHLLQALSALPARPMALVFISSVRVYGRPTGEHLSEKTPLAAQDAYGRSKIQAEKLFEDWAALNGCRHAALRLPTVVTQPLSGKLALLHRAVKKGVYIRPGDGRARQSYVRADDVARIVLQAAAVGGTYNLTDGVHPSLADIEVCMRGGKPQRILSMPLGFCRGLARIGDAAGGPLTTDALRSLTQTCTFSDAEAREQLGWQPLPVLDWLSQ